MMTTRCQALPCREPLAISRVFGPFLNFFSSPFFSNWIIARVTVILLAMPSEMTQILLRCRRRDDTSPRRIGRRI
jgi:hypothetical protein